MDCHAVGRVGYVCDDRGEEEAWIGGLEVGACEAFYEGGEAALVPDVVVRFGVLVEGGVLGVVNRGDWTALGEPFNWGVR